MAAGEDAEREVDVVEVAWECLVESADPAEQIGGDHRRGGGHAAAFATTIAIRYGPG